MKRKRQRLYLVLAAIAALGLSVGISLYNLQNKVTFFRSPTEIATGKEIPSGRFRLGGLVESGSVVKTGTEVAFAVTDNAHTVKVVYSGLLPDLFREGQGVVAEGRLDDRGVFVAREVLAKHDEKYMPPEVADALKKAGRWQEGADRKGMGQ
jgi:cytochrome c-type biogenesis protein CcmE